MGEDVKGTMENEVTNEEVVMANETLKETTAEMPNEAVNEEPMNGEQEPVQMEESVEPEIPAQSEISVEPEIPAQPRTTVWRHDEDSPFSPLYIPDKKQKNNNKITIVFVIVLLLCLIVGMIFAVSKLVQAAVGEVSTEVLSWQESFDNWKEDTKDLFEDEDKVSDWDDEYEDDEFDYDDDFEYDYEGDYVPSPNDEYYVELADAIMEDLSYTVDKEDYSYYDEEESIAIYVEYVTVDGLDFDDKMNEKLEEGAMYYAKQFGAGEVSDLSLSVVSYVTYMDENMLSVVVDERYTWDDVTHVDLYCMNFDLKTGSLLYNTEMINPTEELAEAFRDMSDYQNGYIEHVDEISDREITEYFSDEDSLILFYTPVGLEIGFNYEDGWVTTTLKDFEEYLSRL